MPDQPTRLQKQQLDTLVERQDCTGLAEGELYRLVGAEPQIRRNVPEQGLRVDPRDGMPIVYSMARAQRPHDTSSAERPDKPNHPCPICEGRTSHIIDVAPAGPGVTFINKNLFPVVYPRPLEEDRAISGVHLVQWTSNEHHLDLHNIGDRHMEIVLERLAALEGNLLHRSTEHPLVESLSACETPHHGYVGIIKNYGQQVGGSLSHGHQQIMHSNVRALRVAQDQRFLAREGHSMASHLLGTNPPELTIADYGSAQVGHPLVVLLPVGSHKAVECLLKEPTAHQDKRLF